MQIRTLLSSALLLGLATTLGSASVRPGDEFLKESDHKKLGKEVAAYWSAKTEVKGIQKAFQKLSDAIEKTQKKIAKQGGNVLASIDDWERVFWFATEANLEDKRLKKGKVTTATDDEPTFTYCIGKKYASSKGPFPLVLIVPDAGTEPAGVLDAAWEDQALRDGAILAVVHMDGLTGDWGGEEGVVQVMLTYGRIATSNTFAIDYDRVFVAGTGKGFAAAAATATAYPQLFAGLIGRGEVPAVEVKNFRSLPSLLTGSGDGVDGFTAKLGEHGFENLSTTGDTSADIWAWIQQQERSAYPTHITYSPPISYSRAAHWIAVDGVDLDASPRVDAVADRDANTITIDAEGISTVRVFFNDVLVDMDQPVKVVVNGSAHEAMLTRNKQTMIDTAYQQGDWGRVFTQKASYDVPAKE
jgi:hypothetical protein